MATPAPAKPPMLSVHIGLAIQDDISALAEINRAAYVRETISQFAFKHWPDEKNMFEFFLARISERFQQPQTDVFKAWDPTSGKIYGFVCWTLENGEIESVQGSRAPAVDPTSSVIEKMSLFMNLEFVMSMQAAMEGMKLPISDHKHYYLSAFAVSPASQCRGVGTKLLEHCLQIADRAQLHTRLGAFPGSHSLYLRHGFVDQKYHDTDLAAWDENRYRGYGIYRSYAMVRPPRSVEEMN